MIGPFVALDRAECLELLAIGHVGRVGVSIDALPAILPVSYLLVGDEVVFRSVAGSKLAAIGRGDVVCFEVDDVDRERQVAWSVLVVGRASTVVDAGECASYDELGVDIWPPIDAGTWVRLGTDVVTGRRVMPTPG